MADHVRRQRFLLVAGIAALAVVLAGAPANPARSTSAPEAGPLRLDYALYAGGLRALEFATRVEMDEGGYDLRFQARAAGWVETFFSFALESRALGERTDAGLSPRAFRSAARWNGGDLRWVRLDYAAGADMPRTTAVPPPNADDRARVPDSARRDTVDPLSGLYGLLLGTGDDARCGGAARVFDGRRRFDVTARDRGEARIDGGYTVYSGPARVCMVRVERAAGFWNDARRRERYPAEIRVFLARVVAGAPPLPVRLEADTDWLALRLHLTRVHTGPAAELPATDLPALPHDASIDG